MVDSITTKHKTSRIPSLDGLRAVAICMVLLAHCHSTLPSFSPWQSKLFHFYGHIGVMCFFVLSGYLITRLLLKEESATGSVNLRGFYIRRSLRILPVFYAYLLAVFVLRELGAIDIPNSKFFAAATFSWNYSHLWISSTNSGDWFIGHFWTLSIEEQFYLVWPCLMLLLAGKRRSGVLAIILCMPFIRVATYFLWPEARGHINTMFHTSADTMLIGAGLAIFETHRRFTPLALRWTSTKATIAAGCFILIVSPTLGHALRGAYTITAGPTTEALALAVVIINATRNPSSLFGRLLNHKTVVWIGGLSYSLYIWQQLFLTPKNTTILGQFPWNLGASFLVACASFYFLERPFLSLKERLAPASTADNRNGSSTCPTVGYQPTGSATNDTGIGTPSETRAT